MACGWLSIDQLVTGRKCTRTVIEQRPWRLCIHMDCGGRSALAQMGRKAGTGKGTLWQALETLSSIGGKGGVQKRMKGNSQWISKSASCRDVWTAWLSHSQLSFSDKTFSTVGPQVSWFYGYMLYLFHIS